MLRLSMRRRSAYASTSSSGKSKETRRPAWPGLGEGVPVCRSCSALSRLRGYLSAGNLLRVRVRIRVRVRVRVRVRAESNLSRDGSLESDLPGEAGGTCPRQGAHV
jgi:hypothetical protein